VTVLALAGRDWREAAACRDVDPDLFFPADPSSPECAAQVAEALAVCTECPVRLPCAEFAAGEAFGIWAGTTEGERQADPRHAGLCPAGRHLVLSPDDVTPAGVCRGCKRDRDAACALRRKRDQSGRKAHRVRVTPRTKGLAA
jgi:WhiB family redox-sensing transcriptional regulator